MSDSHLVPVIGVVLAGITLLAFGGWVSFAFSGAATAAVGWKLLATTICSGYLLLMLVLYSGVEADGGLDG